MNDYNKNSFYSEIDEVTGEKKVYIKIKKEKIEVSKDIYNVCYNSYRKYIRDIRRDDNQEKVSYESDLHDNSIIGVLKKRINIDYIDEIHKKDQLKEVLEIISELEEGDKDLITELLIHEKKERELAKSYGVTKQAISKRKKKIIKKIREKIK